MTRPQLPHTMDPARDVLGGDGAPQPGAAPGAMLPEPGGPREVRLAMLAYLGIPFTLCLLPLICYLGQLRGGRSFARGHAAQALALSVAALLYTLCGLIVFGVLALDSMLVAAVIGVPLLAALWLIVLAVVIRSAIAASRGGLRPVPRWLRLAQGSPVSR